MRVQLREFAPPTRRRWICLSFRLFGEGEARPLREFDVVVIVWPQALPAGHEDARRLVLRGGHPRFEAVIVDLFVGREVTRSPRMSAAGRLSTRVLTPRLSCPSRRAIWVATLANDKEGRRADRWVVQRRPSRRGACLTRRASACVVAAAVRERVSGRACCSTSVRRVRGRRIGRSMRSVSSDAAQACFA
jgi:hypothetical protein